MSNNTLTPETPAPETPAPVFSAQDLSITLPGTRAPAISGLSLDVAPGEILAVLARHGSGAETLCDLLAGALPMGTKVTGAHQLGGAPSRKQTRFAYIGDGHRALSPYADAAKQLTKILGRALRLPLGGAREELRGALATLKDAPDFESLRALPAKIAPLNLALAMFAVALAQNPVAILADDPAEAMDPREREIFLGQILAEQKKRGFALLYFTGDPAQAARLGGRIAVLRDGVLVEEGPVRRMRSAQAHAYTQTLFRSLPGQIPADEKRRGPNSEPLLQVWTFAFEKPKKNTRVDPSQGITFDLKRGASLALIGERGSGRRDLARAVAGLAPVPYGRVIFDAVDVGILSPGMVTRLHRRIAFITGDDSVLDPRMRVAEVALEPMRGRVKLRPDEMRQTALAMLTRVGLGETALSARSASLSPLDRRRLQVARVLTASPQLVVLYEPLAGLDVLGKALMLDLLRELRAREGAAFLLITADFAIASALCEEAMVLKDRRVVERGPLAAMLRAPQNPYTAALVAATMPAAATAG